MFLFPSEHAKNKAAILSISLNSKNAIQLAGQAKKSVKNVTKKSVVNFTTVKNINNLNSFYFYVGIHFIIKYKFL